MSKWLLVVFDVPDRHAALLGRLGFRPTKKNPANWWHIYNPKTDHDAADYAREQLRAAGLKGKWLQVEDNRGQVAQESREASRQAKMLAERDTYRRAHNAVRRARGESPRY